MNQPAWPLGAAGGDEVVFAKPWEARAFAIVVSLHERGLFTWAEWADALATRIKAAQAAGDSDIGDTYYHQWVEALERLLVTRAEIAKAAIDECQHDWQLAYENTPHGQPVERRGRTD